eukprot:4781136-Pyramimonas_sp.AAC.1
MPVFFRACQGHSYSAHSIERTYAPCEFGMARCRGHLLHATSLVTIKEPMLGEGASKYPNKFSGLCKAPDYGRFQIDTDEAQVPRGAC